MIQARKNKIYTLFQIIGPVPLPLLQQTTFSDAFSERFKGKKTFCGFSMGSNQYWAGRVYDLCVYYMTGTPEGSTESGFMEKPGIEPATLGLQGIALIHYTTGASPAKTCLTYLPY